MHEVLAPMLWVISRDAIDAKDSTESSKDQPAKYELICNCLDPRFVEHDTFTLFAIIMQTVKSFYEVGTTTQAIQHPTSSNSPIVERSRHIHDVYLRQADPELADHLVAIEILPQIFLIRWIRLLFGREFPLDDVLTIWDILFAEDPTLDLVDLVCVSMLLRIRWQRADYSEALALLLRYPVPPPPNGPATFVADALYLRENISHGGGAHIVHKYSGRSLNEGKDGRKPKARSGKRLKHVRGPENSKTSSPARAASRLLQQQGGIDTIIQGAAMGVYSQGEKWGVNKALRGAVEGLQSAQRQVDAPRWSLDKGSHVPSESDRASEIRTLEQRSKGLAKLLENAIGELWEQQRQCSHDKEEAVANALSVAIAKVQFVQVYLENPTMPFANEHPEGRPVNAESREDVAAKDAPASEPQPVGSPASDKRPNPQQSTALDPVSSHLGMDQSPTDESGDPTDAAAEIKVPKNRPPQLPFHRPRPTLAQSSFSWMLGEDQRKSSFVSPTPVPAERRAAREKAEFLFGDGKADTGGKETGKSEDDEVINLGTLKGRKGKESLR
ncbi:MAG: hypothetical protein L6R39_003118 [Caloplaca ligustica]|nr:MAG: hypothetical protein L6R39_003118 [Caloplaca ligustica]